LKNKRVGQWETRGILSNKGITENYRDIILTRDRCVYTPYWLIVFF